MTKCAYCGAHEVVHSLCIALGCGRRQPGFRLPAHLSYKASSAAVGSIKIDPKSGRRLPSLQSRTAGGQFRYNAASARPRIA